MKKLKLLIIEDEQSLLKALSKGFSKLGYIVETAADGEQALEQYYSNQYSLIILDLNLPKLDGLDVLLEIRKENINIPVLVLSARNEIEDKIKGLDMGANDYLSKPFHFSELEARVRALLRRNFKTAPTVIICDSIRLDTSLRMVFFHDSRVPLTKKEYGILEYLMLNRGRVISGEELIAVVWESDADSFTNAFKVHITAMRKKLPENFIKNEKGQGYYVE